MKSLSIAVAASGLALVHGALAQFYEDPPTTADPNTIRDCTWWHVAASGDSCASIAGGMAIEVSIFQNWNPSLAGSSAACSSKLVIGNSYCIEQNYGLPSEIYTTTTAGPTTTAATTTTSTAISTPTPHRTLPTDCNKFHFVVSGELCPGIASQYGIPLATFYSWNPDVGSTCNNLWLSEYVCVGRVGYTPTTTTSSLATTTTSTGLVTPTPHRTLPNDCNKFHFVVSGNLCPGIASQYNIPLATFYSWNPDVGSNCNNLWLEEYVCVGRVSYVPTTTTSSTTRTTTSTGIATPTPHRTLPTNCDRFHFVVSGDLCPGIASRYGIPLAQFYTWNPDVGSNCNNLWLEEYVCVRTVGYVAPTTTTSRTSTTTTTTNGIATPTPFQPGMHPNCKQFHKVATGNTCATIASQYGITLSNFYAWNTGVGNSCQSLWLDYYVCVRI